MERLLNKGVDDADDADPDETEDPIMSIDTAAFLGDTLRALHGGGQLAPLAAGLNPRRQRAIAALLQ